MMIVNLLGLLLIAAIVWWFWLYHRPERATSDAGAIEIRVDGGVYIPDRIRIPADRATRLRFLRQDPSPCAATVIFEGLNLSAELPLNEVRELVVGPAAPGTYPFCCQMNMYRGTLEVVANAGAAP